jgi:parallel beta-helix repeat protein
MNSRKKGDTILTSFKQVFDTAPWLLAIVVLGFALTVADNQLFAATLCVNPGGTNGCYASINAAVAAASPYDTIQVATGTYSEYVVIPKPLSIVGQNASNTIVDATALPNGLNVDGLDNPGLANVNITGLTVQNANFEGIVVTNSSTVRIWGNNILNNNKNLDPNTKTCPGIPMWETAEGFDCGEGIHLSGVDHSTVASNFVSGNAGGILLSDDTGVTHDNLVSGNTAQDNPYDCGITLASHPPAGGGSPNGLLHNVIYNNTSLRNGLNQQGAGAGVGIFDSVANTKNNGNVVIGNTLMGNGLPGVAMHSHSSGQQLNDNIIAGNTISGNGSDTGDAGTPGTTGINVFGVSPVMGTVISQNTISKQDVSIVAHTPAAVDANLNNLLPSGLNLGVADIGLGTVNATENWWGCAKGPGGQGCSIISGFGPFAVRFTPWLTAQFAH